MSKHPLVLMILDGWGYREEKTHNAIAQANTPQWDQWWQTCPHMTLDASGYAVGLPDAQMGNSEVGHMHMGAGRIIMQDLTRINQAIIDGSFMQNPVFLNVLASLKKTHHTLHIIGLLSHGGVHSHENHLFAFLRLCAEHHFFNVAIHLFLDGRDTPPKSAEVSIALLENHLEIYPVGEICSITGRYFAMDRDNRWERILPTYTLLTEGISNSIYPTALDALNAYYEQDIYDEFIPPTRIGNGKHITDQDAVFFFNFRSDRARELTEAFINPAFKGFIRHQQPHLSHFISMTHYAEYLPTQVAFPPVSLTHTLGETLSHFGRRQLRIAETEKYAHVTFFFNGGLEEIFPLEERILIPSPKVSTYDKQPEMSAEPLTNAIVEAILSQEYDVIICNYANADMVGHTGDFEATVQAITCLDSAMSRIGDALKKVKGQLLITADHGNAECMFDNKTKQPHTAHTSDPVPFLYVGDDEHWILNASTGSLIDIAPTILTLLHLPIPHDMTGKSLLKESLTT